MAARKVGEFAQAEYPVVDPSVSVRDAIAAMRAMHSACVLVVSEERLLGIFTERDFLNRVIGEGCLPGRTDVADVMTVDPEVLQAGEFIGQAIHRMGRGGFRNMPIVDESGRPVGVLSVRDVVEHLSDLFVFEEESSTEFSGAWLDLEGEP
ncbi:MAG: CBS domain-containing protein [Myxococcota bacterium]|nr:CBS domain-containing protein [Myxococcota bacterium]